MRSYQYWELFMGDHVIKGRMPAGTCTPDGSRENGIRVCVSVHVCDCMYVCVRTHVCVYACSGTLQSRPGELNVHELLFSCTIS